MQASREDAKHAEERRALSNSPLSTNVVERLCLPMAYPSGTAMAPAPSPGPRSSLAEYEGETPRDSSPSAPAAETKSRPLSSADVRLLRAATESDQLGGRPALSNARATATSVDVLPVPAAHTTPCTARRPGAAAHCTTARCSAVKACISRQTNAPRDGWTCRQAPRPPGSSRTKHQTGTSLPPYLPTSLPTNLPACATHTNLPP